MPEPSAWKVAKEDQIPATHPNPAMNPFENPYSMDKRAARSRDIEVDDETEEKSSEYRALAHESMEALDRAIEFEIMAATLDARMLALTRREYQIIRARFPWAVDVKNAPWREDEHGFPLRHKLWTIGIALNVTDEAVRQIESRALDKMGRKTRPYQWVDRLVELLPLCFEPPKKRWLAPRIRYEEVIRQ